MEAMRNANDKGSQHTFLLRLSNSHTDLLAAVETLPCFKNTVWVSVLKLLWGASLVPTEQTDKRHSMAFPYRQGQAEAHSPRLSHWLPLTWSHIPAVPDLL